MGVARGRGRKATRKNAARKYLSKLNYNRNHIRIRRGN